MKVDGRKPSNRRITLRLANDILEVLKEESKSLDLPLNTIINRILQKNIDFDRRINVLPSITLTQSLFIQILQSTSSEEKKIIAYKNLQTLKNLFTVLGLEYTLQNILDGYLNLLGKYSGWYSFHYDKYDNLYRLVFETSMGIEWIEFLRLYVTSLLQSLDIKITNVLVAEPILTIEFRYTHDIE